MGVIWEMRGRRPSWSECARLKMTSLEGGVRMSGVEWGWVAGLASQGFKLRCFILQYS